MFFVHENGAYSGHQITQKFRRDRIPEPFVIHSHQLQVVGAESGASGENNVASASSGHEMRKKATKTGSNWI